MRVRWTVLVGIVPVLAACGGVLRPDGAPTPAEREARGRGSGIVVTTRELEGPSTNLITVLRGRIVGMQVSYGGMCPSVVLRSRTSMFGDNNPVVYVDGARAANTCVLDELAPADVARIEVYPQGITSRGGYESHANGLILVFMRTGQT